MADLEKRKRRQALSNFTRNLNILDTLLDDAAPSPLVNKQFEKLQNCWEKLEMAQDSFIEKTDIDIEEDTDGLAYLDGPGSKHGNVLLRYATYLKGKKEDDKLQKEREEEDVRLLEEEKRKRTSNELQVAEILRLEEECKRRFNSAKAEFYCDVETFKRMNLGIKDALEHASDEDKRSVWRKTEAEYKSLKNKMVGVIGIDHTKDHTEMEQNFIDCEKVFIDNQKWILSDLRDAVSTSGGGARGINNAARKEAVRLPSFQGDEKMSPYLKFPVWKKQWDILVVEYDEKWRAGLLWDHIDDVARCKYIGWETDYNEAIKRLEKFFGDPLKVVTCVMKEVTSQQIINDGDYKGLVSYGRLLENNFNRLKSMDLEHEMSNTSAMSLIMRKFPRLTVEKWNEHLSMQESSIKAKPFPEFIQWLASQREMWERMAATEVVKKRNDVNRSFFAGEVKNDNVRKCYGCREEGHIRRFCPKRSGKFNKNNNSNEDEDVLKRPRRSPTVKKYWCAYHKGDQINGCGSNSCQELKRMTDVQKRIQLLKDNGDCVHCCGDHKSTNCYKKDRICGGGKEDRGCIKSHNIHELFCADAKLGFFVQEVQSMGVKGVDSEGVVLSIMRVRGFKKGLSASVFWDLGCTSNFVREGYARLCGFKGYDENLSVTTLGGVITDYSSVTTYNCSIRDEDGELQRFKAYGLECITGSLSKIDVVKMKKLFPHLADKVIQNLERLGQVDILIGMEHPSWHPERAEKAKGGGDLWLFRGRFGSCVGGRHPEMKEGTCRSDSLFSVNHVYSSQVFCHQEEQRSSHMLEFCPKRINKYIVSNIGSDENDEPVSFSDLEEDISSDSGLEGQSTCIALGKPKNPESMGSHAVVSSDAVSIKEPVDDVLDNVDVVVMDNVAASGVTCFGTKTSLLGNEDLFFQSESLGTVLEPKCGGCKCSKCPVPGSKYSFKEQKEYDIIQKNLFYNGEKKLWFTEYPWICKRSVLPKNEKIALQSLITIEKNLARNPEMAEAYCHQIQDMVKRGAAAVISPDELSAWKGDYYYLPHLGVKQKKKSHPLRVCFDASRKQGGYPSMNDCLHKGPDRFMNNLLSVILGFRNGRVGCAADIAKFHNRVHLVDKDVHMQRFLWRGMDTDSEPETYAVKVNNFGVKPANCIATSALHKSADCFINIYPVESREIKEQTYIDDELTAAANMEEVLLKTRRMDEICDHAGMPNKGWTFSGDESSSNVPIGGEVDELGEKVLGILWVPKSDTFNFHVVFRLKLMSGNGAEEIKMTSCEDLKKFPATMLTRRLLLSNVSRIFDPVGLLCPVLLESKLLMRESWCGNVVGWDDPIPEDQAKRWLVFLSSLSSLAEVKFPRSLWPDDEVTGVPMLIIFSDGVALAFGAVAYIRWELKKGGFWTRLVMAKSKIAPKNIVSVPRMELNGAVLGNRIKNFILKETNLSFSNVYQLVDSSTVLGYVHKECGVFKPYEGVRVAEIQSTNEFCDGRLMGWAWVSGNDNPADWCTKPRSVKDIEQGGFWDKGPDFLLDEESRWPFKLSYKTEPLDGELHVVKNSQCAHVQVSHPNVFGCLVKRLSSWKKMIRVMAWIMRICYPLPLSTLSSEEIKRAKFLLIKYSQKKMEAELSEAVKTGTGRYRKLAPMIDVDGIWRVGSRLRSFVPFTMDAKLPVIIPYNHRITLLIMRESHQFCHAGQDGTLSRFRSQGFWSLRAGYLAKKVKNNCVLCRKISHETLHQPLGEFPAERLKEPVAWGYCQMDLFGPFHCRGDVNPRTTKKTWGMVVEDVNSGAVHLDIVQDYSTHAVLSTLRRFGSLRGWPGVICSDPGSQLESAGGKLESWWQGMENSLRTFASSKNFRWQISPPDSPWRQGKAERRIAIVKKLIKLSVGDSRLTPVELQTILMEIANICNERPIGLSKPRDDGCYTLITPNHLLMGRSSNVLPDDTELVDSLPMAARYRLVNHVTSMFWNKWSSEVSPGLVVRQKWHQKDRNLKIGDLVMICEPTKIKAKYRLGVIEEVKESGDGCVRSAMIRYTNVKRNPGGDNVTNIIRINRSVQRLALIMPVEDQTTPMMVNDDDFYAEVCAVQL